MNISTNSQPGSTSRPLRVLVLAPRGAGEHYHGAGTTFYRMYSHAPRDELRASLLHGSPHQSGKGCFDEEVFVSEVTPAVTTKLRFIRRAKRWLRENAHRFDALHAITAFHASLRPASYAETLGLPAVVTVATHRGDLGGRASRISKLLRSPQQRWKMAASVSAMIATSQNIYDEIKSVGVPEANIHRIPYGVNTDTFQPASPAEKRALREEMGLQPDLVTLVFLGDAIRRKRPKLILEALAANAREGRKCQALFVGPASEEDYFEEMKAFVSTHGLEPFVTWAGFQTDVARFLRAGDVFVLASKAEGLPNAMLEAMACGLPAIGTAISGINDLIHPEQNGFIIEPEVDELSQAVRFLVDEPDRLSAYGQHSRSIIKQSYALDVVIPRYISLFRSLAAARQRQPQVTT